jgi:hypothetical protein
MLSLCGLSVPQERVALFSAPCPTHFPSLTVWIFSMVPSRDQHQVLSLTSPPRPLLHGLFARAFEQPPNGSCDGKGDPGISKLWKARDSAPAKRQAERGFLSPASRHRWNACRLARATVCVSHELGRNSYSRARKVDIPQPL